MKRAGRVLIVDDNQRSLELLLDILSSEGYEVHPADSGELALAAVAMSAPDVILMDMKMPGMDGVELCKRLKSRPESQDIPVLFLSASLDFDDRLESLRAGAVDFINKPFRREELLTRLKTHLELARLRKDLERLVAERTAELKAANEELRESEQRFRSISDTAPAGIFLFDRDGQPAYANRWLLAFFGKTMEQLQGEGWLSLVHPEDAHRLLEEIASAVKEQRSSQIEHRLLRKDGEYRWIAATVNPRFVDGQFVGHIGVNLDVSDLKIGQEHALATQKLESLGTLAGGIAHNFNNLLSTILAHSDLAMSEIPSETVAYESISAISAVALRAAEFVNLLMAYAETANHAQPEPIDLSSLIRAMAPLLQGSISTTTTLEMHLAAGLPPIKASRGQIQQVVLNLIVNASEALQCQPGKVSVSTAKMRIGPDTPKSGPSGISQGEYIVLEVSDTGCGMTGDVRARIFDPFFSTKFVGRGLGLPFVQGTVHGAGGAIEVASSPGQGSRFEVWLPCSNGALN